MTSDLERVARALAVSRKDYEYEATGRLREEFMRDARAAVAALREPSKAMMDAAWHSGADEDCDDHWRDMIDAILKGE